MSRAASLAEAIVNYLHDHPSQIALDSINLHLGESGVFDVLIDGVRIFSKHESGEYPTHEEIISRIFSSA